MAQVSIESLGHALPGEGSWLRAGKEFKSEPWLSKSRFIQSVYTESA